MPRKLTSAALLIVLGTTILHAQAPSADPGLMAARMANGQLKLWISKAAGQMDDADYAFRPTPDVRTFGQVIAHVADQNYIFCSAARAEKAPVRDVEKNITARTSILKALSESMTYCDEAYASMTDERGKTIIQFMTRPLPVLAVLLFRTHHNSLHYGNIVTYMRLRGKVPPSTAGMP